ncbi:unnamed protein product, partial [Vitis vinifera]|uniref:Uncharacterized protein n=1 Tax=Vitis vinifera TaxID=29760 RepID=D7U6L7_VITVI
MTFFFIRCCLFYMEFELDIMLSICDADDSGQVFRFHAWKMLGSLPVAFLIEIEALGMFQMVVLIFW